MDTAFSWATVGLYNGMICDWKNEREYRLLGYISHMSENIADGYLQ